MNYRASIIIQFLSIMICSIVVGTGIGFLQGLVVYSAIDFKLEIGLSAFASLYGTAGGAIMGCIVFIVHDYRKIEFEQFSILVSTAFLIGSASGLILNFVGGEPGGGSFFSMFVTLIVAVLGVIYLRRKNIINIDVKIAK